MELIATIISMSVLLIGMCIFGLNYINSNDNFSKCFFYILFALFIAESIAFSIQFLIENPDFEVIQYNF